MMKNFAKEENVQGHENCGAKMTVSLFLNFYIASGVIP